MKIAGYGLRFLFVFIYLCITDLETTEMKRSRSTIILSLLALACLVGWVSCAWISYHKHCIQVAEWKKEAEEAFEKVLWKEMEARASIAFYSYGGSGKIDLDERYPDSVTVRTPNGVRKYAVDKRKYDLSLIKEEYKRSTLGDLFYQLPMNIHTLSDSWKRMLKEKQIPVEGGIRYIYTYLDLQNDTTYSPKVEEIRHLDSLSARYIGLRCEHEWVAYVSSPSWFSRLSFGKACLLLLLWGVFGGLVVLIKKKSVKKGIYMLENLDIRQLPPQSAVLLKLFLSKADHCVSPAEIEQELWNGKGTKDRIHKVVQRLRVELKKVSPDMIIEFENGVYGLKVSISSNNFGKTSTDKD